MLPPFLPKFNVNYYRGYPIKSQLLATTNTGIEIGTGNHSCNNPLP